AFNGTDLWVATGPGMIMTSPDAETWTLRDLPADEVTLAIGWDVAFGGGRWVIVGTLNNALGGGLSSDVGINWTPFDAGGLPGWLRSVVYTGESPYAWIAVGEHPRADVSTDGANWSGEPISNGNAVTFRGIAYDPTT